MGTLGRTAVSYAGYAIGARYGATLGGPVGGIIGAIIGGLLFPVRREQGPKEVAELKVSAPQKGQVLPVLYGMNRIPGHYIWKGKLNVHEPSQGKKPGKGIQPGKDSDQVTTYSATLALALCEGIEEESAFGAGLDNVWVTEASWSGGTFGGHALSGGGETLLARYGQDGSGRPMFYGIMVRGSNLELVKISKTTAPTIVATVTPPSGSWNASLGCVTVPDGVLFGATYGQWNNYRFRIYHWNGSSLTVYLDSFSEGYLGQSATWNTLVGLAFAANTGWLYLRTHSIVSPGGLMQAEYEKWYGWHYLTGKSTTPVKDSFLININITQPTRGYVEIGDVLWWSIDYVKSKNLVRITRNTLWEQVNTHNGIGGTVVAQPWKDADGSIYCIASSDPHDPIPGRHLYRYNAATNNLDRLSDPPWEWEGLPNAGEMPNGSWSVNAGLIAWIWGGTGLEIWRGYNQTRIPAVNSPTAVRFHSPTRDDEALIYVFSGDMNNGTIKTNSAVAGCEDIQLRRIFAGDDVIWDANNPNLGQNMDFTFYKGLPGQQPDPAIAAEIAGTGGIIGDLSPLRNESFVANGSLVSYTVTQPPVASGITLYRVESYFSPDGEDRERRVYLGLVPSNPSGDQFTINYTTGAIVVGGPFSNTTIYVQYQSVLNASSVAQEALAYPHTCYIVLNDYNLGPTTTPPNFTFEVFRAKNSSIPCTGDDINPVVALKDFLTHDRYGLGLVVDEFDLDDVSYTTVHSYVESESLVCSPYLAASESGLRYIEQFLSTYDGFLHLSQGKVKFGVRKPEATSTAVVFSDYTMDDMVTVSRQGMRDTKNRVIVQFEDRTADYNPSEVKVEDDGNILTTDERLDSRSMPWVKRNAVAMKLAVRAFLTHNYQKLAIVHGLDPKWALLEPGDLYAVTDANAGLTGQVFRVVRRIEDPEWGLRIESVEEPLAVVAAVGVITPPTQDVGPWFPALTPVETAQTIGYVVELPYGVVGEQRMLAVVGYGSGVGWQGAEVAVSRDGLDYVQAATISKATGGVLTAPLVQGLEIDFDQAMEMDLVESGGTLATTSREGFWALQNLLATGVTASVAAPSGVEANPDVEIVAFETAALVSGYRYTLRNLLRGVYETPVGTHLQGTRAVRLTNTVTLIPFLASDIGKKLYFKFTSITQFPQSIVVTPTYLTYTPRGVAFQPDPVSGMQIRRGIEFLGVIKRY